MTDPTGASGANTHDPAQTPTQPTDVPPVPPVPPYAAYPPAPSGPSGPARPDTRPKTLALVALIVSLAGFVLVLLGFIPVPGLAVVAVGLGGLALLAGLVLAIVALVSQKQGGKGLGIGALIVSVVGGIIWIFALVAALLWFSLAAFGSVGSESIEPAPTVSIPAEDVDGDVDDAGPATGGEQAFLDEVKPQVLAILQSINPGVTEDDLSLIFSDDQLLQSGVQLGSIPVDQRPAQRDDFVAASVGASGGALTEEVAGQLFDLLIAAADTHLAG